MKSKHDAYYIPSDDKQDQFDDAVAKLMKTPEFDSYDSVNLVEALGELSPKDHDDLQMCLDMRNFEMIGRKIWSLTHAYLEKHAEKRVLFEMEN